MRDYDEIKDLLDNGNDDDDELYNKKPILVLNYEKIFIGKSPEHGSKFDGNSIIVQINELEYVYIGESIYYFEAFSPIKNYVSSVGNSDVPYPYAIDTNGYYYLMIEDIVLTDYPYADNEDVDPYNYHYEGYSKDKSTPLKQIKDLHLRID